MMMMMMMMMIILMLIIVVIIIIIIIIIIIVITYYKNGHDLSPSLGASGLVRSSIKPRAKRNFFNRAIFIH
jgi:biopolymer transport protein ExbB/TolQ